MPIPRYSNIITCQYILFSKIFWFEFWNTGAAKKKVVFGAKIFLQNNDFWEKFFWKADSLLSPSSKIFNQEHIHLHKSWLRIKSELDNWPQQMARNCWQSKMINFFHERFPLLCRSRRPERFFNIFQYRYKNVSQNFSNLHNLFSFWSF